MGFINLIANKRNLKAFGFILIGIFFSCSTKNKHKIEKQAVLPNTALAKNLNYDSCKKAVILIKQKNKSIWHTLTYQQKEKIFTKCITESIAPNWIGTAWDFNGITETPQKGSIACGYFVTTVLQHGGVSLNRVKLAQCASQQMITSLIAKKYINQYSNIPINKFVEQIKLSGYGLFIVGLDNHTGFLFNDGTNVYFIHSTFVGTRNVQKELAEKSWVLASSKYKVIGKLSADEAFLNKWINS